MTGQGLQERMALKARKVTLVNKDVKGHRDFRDLQESKEFLDLKELQALQGPQA